MAADASLRARLAQARATEASYRGLLRRFLRFLWKLTVRTTRTCLRYRVTGLAAEAGFFALLSLPPLVLGLVGSIGFIGQLMGQSVVADLRQQLRELTLTFLTADSVASVILPTFDQVLDGGRADIVSLGFVLSLWSGSRALNVYVDTISIMYGLGGHRGIVRTRVLSFSLYVGTLLAGVVLFPLVLVGPGMLARLLESANLHLLAELGGSNLLYWPVVTIVAVTGLTTLFHIATPVRSPWRHDLPGAVLALLIWVLASYVLRWTIAASVDGASIYGPLAAPIVVLIWLYFLAIAVLIGAALNAVIDEMFPSANRVAARRAGGAFEGTVPMTPQRDPAQEVGWPDDVPLSGPAVTGLVPPVPTAVVAEAPENGSTEDRRPA
ncbi:YihY/virulence factor BrkB family protein [Spongisporangium articulatum]|uniref:YihY/virulence factor BrkB family protein n=1 Tax=Spongisporangium articulatum TaxID=3362603 RepID=A0ABW8AU89_9ACTN